MPANPRSLTALLWFAASAGPVHAAVTLSVAPKLVSGAAAAQLRVFGAPDPATRSGGLSRLDGALADVAAHYAALNPATALGALHALNPAARFRFSAPLALPEVLIDAVSLDDPQALLLALKSLGLEQPAVFSNDVGGWLPVNQLGAAAALSGLHHIRASMPRTRSGAVTSQGDFAIYSDLIRSTTALTGAGVTVGVLSDSFNCYPVYASNHIPASGNEGYAQNGFIADYATDIQTGDLPANVNVLEEADCLDYGAPEQLPDSDEGRAILQIVHDVAPGANLAFYTAFDSEADFANGIVKLASSAGAKVIDDDVGYSDEPFYQDGMLAQAIDQVEGQGVAYFSSAGNNGVNSYENTAPAFSSVTSTTGPNAGEKLLNFDTSGATVTTALSLSIPALQPGQFITLELEWDQPYVTGAPGSPGAANSLDLCVSGNTVDQLTDENGNTVTCTGPNAVGSDPVQLLVLGVPANAAGSSAAEKKITVSIGLAGGNPPGRVKFVLADDGAGSTITDFQTNSPTLQGHPGAAGAAAVGAAFYFDTPRCGTTPATLESFSSAGGDPILFDTSGTRLATPEIRQKPDFVGPDGVNNTFLGYLNGAVRTTITQCVNDTSYPNFFGTSAAAPHAAAVAALMLQANSADTPSQIYAAFRASALPMGGSFNYDSGYGFIQADAALALLPVAASSSSSSSSSSSGSSSSGSSSSGSSSSGSSSSGSSSSSSSGATGPAAESSGSSSGGSFDVWSLFALGALLIMGRRRKARAAC